MGLSSLDYKIADYYAGEILAPVKYGESGVFFWFPGCGMTTIVQDIFRERSLVKKHLDGLAKRQTVVQFWGHLATQRNLSGLLESAGSTIVNINKLREKTIEEGKELVCVIGRIDNFPAEEKQAILKFFLRLNAVNRRRVHIIFNSVDKPWFDTIVGVNPEFLSLANFVETMAPLPPNLIRQYIKEKSHQFSYPLSKQDETKIYQAYAGIIQLTKEYLRAKGNTENLDLKLKNIWQAIPESYQKIITDKVLGLPIPKNSPQVRELQKFGVLNISVFKDHWAALKINSPELLPKLLTPEELNLWNRLKNQPGELISKDQTIEVLRPQKAYEVTLWTIDQAVSRFRKKLARAGIDPIQLRTIKGKGYIWQEI